jgi:hypothetical protein
LISFFTLSLSLSLSKRPALSFVASISLFSLSHHTSETKRRPTTASDKSKRKRKRERDTHTEGIEGTRTEVKKKRLSPVAFPIISRFLAATHTHTPENGNNCIKWAHKMMNLQLLATSSY